MRRPAAFLALALALFLAQLASSGCSNRVESGVADADSTRVFASREPDGVDARITFCEKIGKSGKPIGVKRAFRLKPKGRVRALIELRNHLALGDDELMFHLVWLGPDGNEFYTKRIDYRPDDTPRPLKSGISIPPDKREPGTYTLRVYLFRERIAEKTFELLPARG